MEQYKFFSLVLRVVSDNNTGPLVLMVDATCDLCHREFLVRSPTDANGLLDVLAHHMRNCPPPPVT